MAYVNYLKYLNGETVKFTDFVSEEEYYSYLNLIITHK